MKRDTLRAYIEKAHEAYELASHPQNSGVYKKGIDDPEVCLRETTALAERREALLRIGIDVKYIVSGFYVDLVNTHGDRRANRFMDYLAGKQLNEFNGTNEHRMQIINDRKRLYVRIRNYRQW